MSFNPSKDLSVELDAEGLGKKVTCIPCNAVLFELNESPTNAKRLLEMKAIAAHLELTHDLFVYYGRCQDPQCRRFHLSAFEKDKVPPELRGRRSQG